MSQKRYEIPIWLDMYILCAVIYAFLAAPPIWCFALTLCALQIVFYDYDYDYNEILIWTNTRPTQVVISIDLEWLSEIVNDTKHRAVSLRQLSSLLVNQLESGLARDMLTSCRLQSNCTVMLETETMFHDNRLTQSTKNSPKFGHVRAYATYLQRNKLSICWSFMKRDPGPWPIRWYKQILENQPIS